MIGKVTFKRGETVTEASLNDRGIWICQDPLLERYLNMLPQERDRGPLDDAVAYEHLCCAADIFEGDVFLDV